jgi:hypothetical protein
MILNSTPLGKVPLRESVEDTNEGYRYENVKRGLLAIPLFAHLPWLAR